MSFPCLGHQPPESCPWGEKMPPPLLVSRHFTSRTVPRKMSHTRRCRLLPPPPLPQLAPLLVFVRGFFWLAEQALLDAIVAQEVVAKVLHGIEHLLARRDDLVAGQQEPVASR